MGKIKGTKEEYMQTLRKTALEDTDLVSTKQRFALFSQPPPLSIGDDSLDVRKKEPRNLLPGAGRSGKSKSSYFSDLGYITIDDKYIEQDKLQRQQNMKKNALIPADKGIFKPANGYKTIVNLPYEYVEEKTDAKKYTAKVENGKVQVGPTNVLTGPSIKGLYVPHKHLTEPYERPRELIKKEREKHKNLMKDRPPFYTWDHGEKAFAKDSVAYKVDIDPSAIRVKKENPIPIVKHDNAFRYSHPPKKGYNKTINPFPKYEPDPIRQTTKKEFSKEKDSFKPNHGGNLTRPTPSISLNPINLKKEATSFRL